MGIRVECPNGHVFKVKEKYAGKKGFCPKCDDKVEVQVPDILSTMTSSPTASPQSTGSRPDEDLSESVLDERRKDLSGSKSGSLLNSSLIREKAVCKKCGARVPIWYASCSECGAFMEGD